MLNTKLRGPSAETLVDNWASTLAQQAVVGRKDDGGKLDMTLLDDMPRAIRAVVEVMQWAITLKKNPYTRSSWLGVEADRYRAAIMRHMRDAAEQSSAGPLNSVPRFQRDYETNLLHLAHVATGALMALENTLREMEQFQHGEEMQCS